MISEPYEDSPSLQPLRGANSIHQHQRTRCFPLLYEPTP